MKSKRRKVTFVIGEICSGKTTYANSAERQYKRDGEVLKTIDVGSLVREITSTQDRVFDEKLDKEISQRITQAIFETSCDVLIVGVRQISILEKVEEFCKDELIRVRIVLLECSKEVREKRYYARGSSKDVKLVFDFADQKDKELGLFALLQYVKHKKETVISKNH